MRFFQTAIFVLFLLSVDVLADSTNDVMAKAATGFVNSFSSVFIPIIIFGAIISIGFSMAQKKPEIIGYGCGTIFLIGLAMVIIDFIKTHSTFFTIAGFIVAFILVILFLIAKYEGVDFSSENKSHDNLKSSEPCCDSDFEKKKNTMASSLSQSNTQSEITPSIRDPLRVYPATYQEVVGQIPSATEMAGKLGEDEVSKAVWTACQFDGRYYKILRNVYVPVRGGYSEIDVLLLHETGVYVFESKNVAGIICGDEFQSHWQRYKSNGEKEFIPNPVKQNESHINALCEFLQLNKYQFRVFNVIVFGTSAKLKAVPENTSLMSIYEVYNLETDLVKKMMAEKIFYNTEIIDSWFKKLLTYTQLSDGEKKAHREKVAQKFHRIN